MASRTLWRKDRPWSLSSIELRPKSPTKQPNTRDKEPMSAKRLGLRGFNTIPHLAIVRPKRMARRLLKEKIKLISD